MDPFKLTEEMAHLAKNCMAHAAPETAVQTARAVLGIGGWIKKGDELRKAVLRSYQRLYHRAEMLTRPFRQSPPSPHYTYLRICIHPPPR